MSFPGSGNMVADMSKNNNTYYNNGGVIDSDRQWLHVSNTVSFSTSVLFCSIYVSFCELFCCEFNSKVSQLMETTRRLEARIKFNQKLQWITVLVFLLLSIAIVYILKIEINNSVSSGSEYCSSRSKHY